jgi:hypothetical protein
MRRGQVRVNPGVLLIFLVAFIIFVGAMEPILTSLLEAFFPLLILGAIVFIGMKMAGVDRNSIRRAISGNTSEIPTQEYKPQIELIRRREIADKALHRAGRRADDPQVQLGDIGLLVYEGDNDPKICRLSDVPTNATHIRPFIVLELPELPDTGGNGVIRFNLVDGLGKLRYTSRSRYTVKRGQNFITPKTWLPLADQQVDGAWSLQVCVGDSAPFAIHEFEWLHVGGEARAQFNGDGEIDELMQPAFNQSVEESISLDELLADQGDEAPLVMGAKR